MTVTRVRAAITDALKDKRITPAEAKLIAAAAEQTATGKKDKVDRAEALEIASVYARGASTGPVKLGADARQELNNFFWRNELPFGAGAALVQQQLDAAIPAKLPPALKKTPNVADLTAVALTPNPALAQPPLRTGYYDFLGKTFFLEEKVGTKSKWYGPFANAPATDPDASLLRAPAKLIDVHPRVTPGDITPTAIGGGFKYQGTLAANQQLELQLSSTRTIRVQGPAVQQKLVKAINDALPPGYYAEGRFVGGTWFADMIHEVTPHEGDFIIRVFHGERPGGPVTTDLPKLREMKDNLLDWKKSAPIASLPAASWPAYDSRSKLYKAPNGNALMTVWLEPKPKSSKTSREAALYDPRTSEIYFADLGGAHPSISAPRIGPPHLQLQPSGRYFTWDEIREMAAVANR